MKVFGSKLTLLSGLHVSGTVQMQVQFTLTAPLSSEKYPVQHNCSTRSLSALKTPPITRAASATDQWELF